MIDSAGTVGVQDSRRIVGEYEMTMDDLLECREFEDVIALGCYPIDLHNPMGRGYDMGLARQQVEAVIGSLEAVEMDEWEAEE